MIVRINQTAVDFTLEHETTLAQFLASLGQWAAAEQLSIRGILVDGLSVDADERPLTSVRTIDVETVPLSEEQRARADVIATYFDLVSQAARSSSPSLVDELHREYPSVRAALFPLLAPWEGRLTEALGRLDGPWTNSLLAEAADELSEAASARLKELQAPAEALAETLTSLEVRAASLNELGLLFQRGQDKDAFARILSLFTVVEDVERRAELYVKQNADVQSAWTDFSTEWQPFLKETEAALDAGDYILLTDLLEYEILPRLLSLRPLFPALPNLDPVGGVL